MRPINFVALALSVAAIALLVFVGWQWSLPLSLVSIGCSVVALRGTRVSLNDRGIEIQRRAREQAPISANSLRSLERQRDRATRRRSFEPFCECPGCGVPTWHLFGPAREAVDSHPEWVAGPGRLWMEEGIEFSVWNKPGLYKVPIREEGWMEMRDTTVTVIDRECLSCEHKWEEVPS